MEATTIDFNTIILPGGKLQGMTIPQAWNNDREEYLRLLGFVPMTDAAKFIQPAMKAYADMMLAQGMPAANYTYGNQTTGAMGAAPAPRMMEPAYYQNPEQPNVQGTETNISENQRYINQIGVVRHSNRDKTQCTTLAVDASVKKKIFDEGTISPLTPFDDTSRFKFILIDKQQAKTIIRKANISLDALMHLKAQYYACVQSEILKKLGIQLTEGVRIPLYDKDYSYMTDPKGKRLYHLVINFTLGNNSPFYIGISNKIEGQNGEKEDLKTGYCNLTSEEFGMFLDEMISFKKNFTSQVFSEAMENAKAGGYKDIMKKNK